MQPQNFPGKRSFVELELFNKHFIKNTRKKKPYKEILWSFFLLDTLIITFWMENLILRRTQSGPFFGHFFWFQKMGKGGLPHYPLLVQVWLNMHQYPWISLNILGNAWVNCSGYAWSSYMFDRFLKMPWALNLGSEYGTVVYARV